MTNDADPVLQTRLDVAEMKGMLSAFVVNVNTKVSSHDVKLENHDKTLVEHGNHIGRQDERIKDAEGDIAEQKRDNSGRHGRNLASLSLLIAGILAIIQIFNFINGAP